MTTSNSNCFSSLDLDVSLVYGGRGYLCSLDSLFSDILRVIWYTS
jgi:hypothetical protein